MLRQLSQSVDTPGTPEAGPSASSGHIPGSEETPYLRYCDLYNGCAEQIKIIWDSAVDQDRFLPDSSKRSKEIKKVALEAFLYHFLDRKLRSLPLSEVEQLRNNLHCELSESTLYTGFRNSLPGGGLD